MRNRPSVCPTEDLHADSKTHAPVRLGLRRLIQLARLDPAKSKTRLLQAFLLLQRIIFLANQHNGCAICLAGFGPAIFCFGLPGSGFNEGHVPKASFSHLPGRVGTVLSLVNQGRDDDLKRFLSCLE